jgi:hypothetical protein
MCTICTQFEISDVCVLVKISVYTKLPVLYVMLKSSLVRLKLGGDLLLMTV